MSKAKRVSAGKFGRKLMVMRSAIFDYLQGLKKANSAMHAYHQSMDNMLLSDPNFSCINNVPVFPDVSFGLLEQTSQSPPIASNQITGQVVVQKKIPPVRKNESIPDGQLVHRNLLDALKQAGVPIQQVISLPSGMKRIDVEKNKEKEENSENKVQERIPKPFFEPLDAVFTDNILDRRYDDFIVKKREKVKVRR